VRDKDGNRTNQAEKTVEISAASNIFDYIFSLMYLFSWHLNSSIQT